MIIYGIEIHAFIILFTNNKKPQFKAFGLPTNCAQLTSNFQQITFLNSTGRTVIKSGRAIHLSGETPLIDWVYCPGHSTWHTANQKNRRHAKSASSLRENFKPNLNFSRLKVVNEFRTHSNTFAHTHRHTPATFNH